MCWLCRPKMHVEWTLLDLILLDFFLVFPFFLSLNFFWYKILCNEKRLSIMVLCMTHRLCSSNFALIRILMCVSIPYFHSNFLSSFEFIRRLFNESGPIQLLVKFRVSSMTRNMVFFNYLAKNNFCLALIHFCSGLLVSTPLLLKLFKHISMDFNNKKIILYINFFIWWRKNNFTSCESHNNSLRTLKNSF